MPVPNTADLTVRELLDTTIAINAEFRRRGLIRTGTSLAGELMEHVVARAYEAHLEAPVNAGWDATASDGTRIQVKARFLDPGVRRPFTFKSLDFDIAVVVWLDATTFTISWAREISREDIKRIATPHGASDFRVSPAKALAHGQDVTEALREAMTALDLPRAADGPSTHHDLTEALARGAR